MCWCGTTAELLGCDGLALEQLSVLPRVCMLLCGIKCGAELVPPIGVPTLGASVVRVRVGSVLASVAAGQSQCFY